MVEIFEELEKQDVKDILGYALESERAATTYYKTLAKSAAGLAATRLENLAREEEMHEKTVKDIYKKEFGDARYTIPGGLPPLESAVEIDTVTSLIHALETAMKNEYNAYRVYTYLAKKVKTHKSLFTYLAGMEKGHYDIVKTEKDTYESTLIEIPHLKDKTPKDFWLEVFRVQ
jgi:rubrerythrin